MRSGGYSESLASTIRLKSTGLCGTAHRCCRKVSKSTTIQRNNSLPLTWIFFSRV